MANIDDLFYSVLFDNIESEVDLSVKKVISLISNDIIAANIIDSDNDPLVKTLRDEVSFLKEQLASKNEIIQNMYRATAKEKTKSNDNKNLMTNKQKSSEVKKIENKSSKVTRSSKPLNNNDITVNNSYDTHKGDNDG